MPSQPACSTGRLSSCSSSRSEPNDGRAAARRMPGPSSAPPGVPSPGPTPPLPPAGDGAGLPGASKSTQRPPRQARARQYSWGWSFEPPSCRRASSRCTAARRTSPAAAALGGMPACRDVSAGVCECTLRRAACIQPDGQAAAATRRRHRRGRRQTAVPVPGGASFATLPSPASSLDLGDRQRHAPEMPRVSCASAPSREPTQRIRPEEPSCAQDSTTAPQPCWYASCCPEPGPSTPSASRQPAPTVSWCRPSLAWVCCSARSRPDVGSLLAWGAGRGRTLTTWNPGGAR